MTNFPGNLNRSTPLGLCIVATLACAPARGEPRPPRASSAGPSAPVDPLQEGQQVLLRRWFVWAFRACRRAVDSQKDAPYRAAAFVCQGRAALGLKWPQQAAHLAQQALALRDDDPVRLLLGDALRAQGDCRGARPQYLLILERDPSHREALLGLRACVADWPPPAPPPPDLSSRLLTS